MAPRPASLMAAVMNEDHRAVEGGNEFVSGPDIGSHILVFVLRAVQRAVNGVDHDSGDLSLFAQCGLNGVDERVSVFD